MIPSDVKLSLVENWDDACAFRRWLSQRRNVLAVDTETSGFDWWDGRLRLVQFGDLTEGWAIPWETWAGLSKQALEEYEGPTAYHNAKFDVHWLEHNGVKLRRNQINCTATVAHLLEPDLPVALKSVAARHVDPDAAAGQTELKKAMSNAGWTWDTLPVDFDGYWIYSALDTVLTAHLHEARTHLVPTDLYDLEMASMFVLCDMESRGIRVDRDYANEKKTALLDYAGQAREWVQETYGFGAGSNKLIAAQFLKDGVHLSKRTDGGGWSMDESVLSAISHPLADAVMGIRKSEKTANAYFNNILEMAEGEILHPGVRALGARTGRMSVANPSMQNLPRGRLVRDAFVAREGNVLIGCDYSQIEMRLVAHYSGDPGLVGSFGGEIDFFTAAARVMFRDPDLQKDDERRQHMKNAMYAKTYGSGPRKFADTAGITVDEAKGFMNGLDDSFPGLRTFSNMVMETAATNERDTNIAFIRTPMGRRLVAPEGRTYALVNAAIQGTAADVFKQAMVQMNAAGLGQFFVLPIHDEMVLDVPLADADDAERVLRDVMTDLTTYRVPLECDSHQGQRMGDLK